MVEWKNSFFDDHSDESPPLVAARAFVGLDTLEPIGVEVVTIDGDALCQEASVISNECESDEAEGNSRNTSGDGSGAELGPDSQAWSAGVAGGFVATLVGGPVFGIIAGGAAAYYSQREGAAGDISRAVGEVGRATGQKAKELNEKHQLVDKGKEVAGHAWQKVHELNEKHNIADKGQAAAVDVLARLREYEKKHGVINKLSNLALLFLKKLIKFIELVAEKVIEPVEQPAQLQSLKPETVH